MDSDSRVSSRHALRPILGFTGILLAGLTVSANAAPPDPKLLEEFRRDPIGFVADLRTQEAIQCGQTYLEDPTCNAPARTPALTALGAIYLSADRPHEAKLVFREILNCEPLADIPEPDRLAPGVCRVFYATRDSLLTVSGKAAPPDIRTVAFGDIENNSILATKYDLDKFCKGLVQIMITDLRTATTLKIVDRQRLNVLRDEIQLSAAKEVVAKDLAVPVGKLTGAQSYIFGQLMQVTDAKIRLDLRWVETATSEVLETASFEAKLGSTDDLFKLEQRVLVETLAPRIETLLKGEADAEVIESKARGILEARKKGLALADDVGYVDYLVKAGEALALEDSGDTRGAEVAWNEARAIYPDDPYAEARVNALSAWNHLEKDASGDGR